MLMVPLEASSFFVSFMTDSGVNCKPQYRIPLEDEEVWSRVDSLERLTISYTVLLIFFYPEKNTVVKF